MKTTIFNYLENIIKLKDTDMMHRHLDDLEFEKGYSIFMINRYLSMHVESEISSVIIEHQKMLEALTPQAHYQYLLRVIPKSCRSFITYIK